MRRSDNRSSRSRILALLTFVSTAIAIPIGCNDIAIQTGTEPNAPIYGFLPDGVSHPNIIPDQYIVVLKEGSRAAQREAVEEEASEIGANILQSYDSEDFQGFLAHIPRAAIEHVRRYEEVAWIEADRFGERTGLQTCPGWNLDMLDHQSKPSEDLTAATMLDDVYSYAATGAGATVLIVDTGIDKNEFPAGQAIDGNTLFPDTCAPSDPDGHGTMMAAVVAGKTTGVAKNAKVIGYNAANWSRCRELIDANDPTKGTRCMAMCPAATCPMARPIISDDVAALLDISQKVGTVALPAGVVVLLPHSFDALDADHLALEQHVRTIVNKGGIFITSAGNSLVNAHNVVTSDACDFTPARASDRYPESDRIITVGGLSPQGLVGAFNTGSCVDLFAPATGIRTRRPSGACGPARDTTDSGTSYAAAHVAGIAALMQENRVELNQFKYSLVGMATRKMTFTDGLPGSPNLVLNSPYNQGQSGVDDEDGKPDKIKLCNGLHCPLCDVTQANPCNTDPTGCTERVRCTGDECARCGREGDRCCLTAPPAAEPACEGGLACENGSCACGGVDQACCVNAAEPCNNGALVCKNQKCVECGIPGAPCCPGGECNASDIQCLGGTCVSCGKRDDVCCPNGNTPCLDQDTACIGNTCKECGSDGHACCLDNGQAYCNGTDLECVGGKCAKCGTSGAACCIGADGPFCTSTGLDCVNSTCQGCGASGADCCVDNGQTYCSGIDYQCISGKCNACGANGQACCAGPDGAYCVGAGTECINNTCTACGGVNEACCVNGTTTYCVGSHLECTGGTCTECGDNDEPCCRNDPNGSCNDLTLGCSASGLCVDDCVATCCDGTRHGSNYVDPKQCIRQGDVCWNHGGPEEIHHNGQRIWRANACDSLANTWAECCNGELISLAPQFDPEIAEDVADEQCGIWFNSKARTTYMDGQIVASIFPGTCGACEVLCCDGTLTGGDSTNYPGDDPPPGNTPELNCQFFHGMSCRSHGGGPQWVHYNHGTDEAPVWSTVWSKEFASCPTMVPCVAICQNNATVFVGDHFSKDLCNFFASHECTGQGSAVRETYLGGSPIGP